MAIDRRKIGVFMRREREKKGWNKARLARKIGISQSNLMKMESGRRVPNILEWMRFCEIMQLIKERGE